MKVQQRELDALCHFFFQVEIETTVSLSQKKLNNCNCWKVSLIMLHKLQQGRKKKGSESQDQRAVRQITKVWLCHLVKKVVKVKL